MKNLLFLLLLLFTVTGLSQENCKKILEVLANKPVAIAEVSTHGKRIPTVLVNKKSIDSVKNIFEQSLGIVVIHQKGYRNDHGMIRVGNHFIDRDAPGFRAHGEIQSTGLSWASVEQYVNYNHNRNGYNRIEVLFHLSEAEYKTSMVYQLMRRAAIIRPHFQFGGATNPLDKNNVLDDCGEICFSFSTGSALNQQINSIQRKLLAYELKNLKEIQASEEVSHYLEKIKTSLFEMQSNHENLSPDITYTVEIPRVIKDLGMSPDKEAEFLNWLIGLEISENYFQLLTLLGIHNSSNFSNVSSPRASAVLIYDGNTNTENFLAPQYTSEGIFSTWKNEGLLILQNGEVLNVEPENKSSLEKIKSFFHRLL